MKHSLANNVDAKAPPVAWLVAVLAGILLPAAALLWLRDVPGPAPLALIGGPILAVGLMGMGMIAAAAAGRLWIGVALALLAGVGLILLARLLGMPALPHPVSTGLAVVVATISFAARGSLFARAIPGHGWLMALFVVGGEAAMLYAAAWLPAWLLVLLPAQWASTAIQTALTGTGTRAASSALFALAGTAATTLVVARLWPRRWPYAIMFSAWLGLSALVWHQPGPPRPRADLAIAAAPAGAVAPMAASAPDAATASALARVQRQVAKWPAAADPDLAQRARNLLLIAAVPDLYDSEPLQSYLPALVAAELKARIPDDQRAAILRGIAAAPDQGRVDARASLPELGLPGSTGSEAPVRNRMALYAARFTNR
jgi:hypothetical protein